MIHSLESTKTWWSTRLDCTSSLVLMMRLICTAYPCLYWTSLLVLNVCLAHTAHPHLYWWCAWFVLRILSCTEDLPDLHCTYSLVLHIAYTGWVIFSVNTWFYFFKISNFFLNFLGSGSFRFHAPTNSKKNFHTSTFPRQNIQCPNTIPFALVCCILNDRSLIATSELVI